MEKYLVEGNISVKAALLAHRRIVFEVIVDEKKKDKDTNYILHCAYDQNIPVRKTSREEIDALASGKTHGGCIAFVGERIYQTLDEIEKEAPFFAIMEGIEDPFNFGYICRSLYAAGCDGLIVPSRNWSSEVTTVTKSSAGASEFINIIPSDHLEECIGQMKAKGVQLFCAMRKDAISYTQADYTKGICVAFGGEKRGLSRAVLDRSDQNIFIDYAIDFKNALNGASATSIVAFEVLRQRKK